MQHDIERLRACAQAVGTEWASTAFRSPKQRQLGASCLRIAILNVLGYTPQDDAIALLGADPTYRRVVDKFARDLDYHTGDALDRYQNEL